MIYMIYSHKYAATSGSKGPLTPIWMKYTFTRIQSLSLTSLDSKMSVYKGPLIFLYDIMGKVAGADWPAVFLPSVASVCVFLALNVRLS
jgi:hypothetical protein